MNINFINIAKNTCIFVLNTNYHIKLLIKLQYIFNIFLKNVNINMNFCNKTLYIL